MVFIRIMNIMVFRTLESMSVIFYWSDIALFLKFLICKIWSSDSKWFLCIWKMWIFVSSTINILLSLTVLFMLYYCSSIPYIFSIYTFQLFSELFLVLAYQFHGFHEYYDGGSDDFKLWCWRRLLRVLWTARRCNQSIVKENQSWIFTGRTVAEAEAPILWPPDAKSQLTGKDPDAGKDWREEEKGTTEDGMIGCHY